MIFGRSRNSTYSLKAMAEAGGVIVITEIFSTSHCLIAYRIIVTVLYKGGAMGSKLTPNSLFQTH